MNEWPQEFKVIHFVGGFCRGDFNYSAHVAISFLTKLLNCIL